MYQLLVSGNQQHVEERSWVLHLLAAGLRGPQDAQLYRSAVSLLYIFLVVLQLKRHFLVACPA